MHGPDHEPFLAFSASPPSAWLEKVITATLDQPVRTPAHHPAYDLPDVVPPAGERRRAAAKGV